VLDDWRKKVKWEFIQWRQYVAIASYDQEPEYNSEVMGRSERSAGERFNKDNGGDGPVSVTRFSFLTTAKGRKFC